MMSHIKINKVGNLIETIHLGSDCLIKKMCLNSLSGFKIVMFPNESIETNLLSEHNDFYTFEMFEDINGVTVSNQEELYVELKKLLE